MISMSPMSTRESKAAIGQRRSRVLRQSLGEAMATARKGAGMSLREVARVIGVSPQRVARAERGDPTALTIDLAARIAPVLGLQLASALYPSGDPVRDKAHLALLERFRRRLGAGVHWRVEVPIPIPGDPRSGDAVVVAAAWDALVEAETHVDDIQAIERRSAAKARDLRVRRLILIVSDTRHNRAVLDLHPELNERFPVGTRACLAALGRGLDPGGDALVII